MKKVITLVAALFTATAVLSAQDAQKAAAEAAAALTAASDVPVAELLGEARVNAVHQCRQLHPVGVRQAASAVQTLLQALVDV